MWLWPLLPHLDFCCVFQLLLSYLNYHYLILANYHLILLIIMLSSGHYHWWSFLADFITSMLLFAHEIQFSIHRPIFWNLVFSLPFLIMEDGYLSSTCMLFWCSCYLLRLWSSVFSLTYLRIYIDLPLFLILLYDSSLF